jgi:hypothetical protein
VSRHQDTRETRQARPEAQLVKMTIDMEVKYAQPTKTSDHRWELEKSENTFHQNCYEQATSPPSDNNGKIYLLWQGTHTIVEGTNYTFYRIGERMAEESPHILRTTSSIAIQKSQTWTEEQVKNKAQTTGPTTRSRDNTPAPYIHVYCNYQPMAE